MSFMDRMFEISPGTILPTPPDFYSTDFVANMFSIWAGGFALLALPFAFKKLIKDKDSVLLLMWVGGLICSLLEPMLDHLGHLHWSRNLPGPAFTGFDLNIPYLIPPCYVFFISMTGYWAYTKFAEGITVGGVFKVFGIIALSDVIMEIPGTHAGAYAYYGDVPFKVLGFPLFWGWINGFSMLSVGFLLWLVAPHLEGWKKICCIPLVTVSAMGAAYGIGAWPYFMAINWPMPVWATYVASLASLAITLISVRFIAAVVAKDSPVAAKSRLATA